MLKIRTKITLISTTFYCLLLLLIGIFAVNDVRESFEKIYDARLEKYFDRIENDLKFILEIKGSFNNVDINNAVKFEIEDVEFQVYNSDLKLLSEKIENFSLDEEFGEQLYGSQEPFIDGDDKGFNEHHSYFRFKEIEIGNRKLLFVGKIDASELDFEYYKHKVFFVLGIPIYILIITIISSRLGKAAFNPISEMIKKVKKITSTNLHQRLELSEAKDEIRDLGITLNGMITRLERAFESQKNFIANASHEIKTPLTIIRADLENLKDQMSDEQLMNDIDRLIVEVDRLTHLSKSLLELSKLDTGETSFQSIRLDELLIECSQFFYKKAAEKNIVFNISLDGDFTIEGDRDKLFSVFQNLIDNAIKYSSSDKQILLQLLCRDKNQIEIVIEDNGFGICKDDLEKIFTRFFRGADHRALISGNGLGLAIAEQIIKSHNGTIKCESEIGKGTRFKVTLPVQQNNYI